MKTKIIILLALVFVLSGCENIQSDTSTIREWQNGTYRDVYDYTDPETGVHYLIYVSEVGCGLTVRYNSDGSIMVEEE